MYMGQDSPSHRKRPVQTLPASSGPLKKSSRHQGWVLQTAKPTMAPSISIVALLPPLLLLGLTWLSRVKVSQHGAVDIRLALQPGSSACSVAHERSIC